MNWARLAANTQLRHDFESFPPGDHWAQVTVQLTSQLGTPLSTPGEYATPYFVWLANWDGLAAHQFCDPAIAGPCWQWQSRHAAFAAPSPPVANVPFTVGYHCRSGGSVFDWYIDGVYVGTDTSGGFGAMNYVILNAFAPFGCCQVVYYTDFRVGTSQGASDLWADDFSSGNLDNWYAQSTSTIYPVIASIVGVSADDPCASLSISPTRAGPGEPIEIIGTGFTPGAPVTLNWQDRQGYTEPEADAVIADGIGGFDLLTVVPLGVGNGSNGNFPISSNVIAVDVTGRVACTTIEICTNANADGIRADWDNSIDQNPLNTPDPLVAFGGTTGSPGHQNNSVLDYIFHDGNHWVLWADESAIENAGVFPPPTNHALNATCISPDGSSVVDYPIDTEYCWNFDVGSDDPTGLGDAWDCGSFTRASPVWSFRAYFSSWTKPIYDARFASDGATLWVGVVTAETVPYPYLDNRDAHMTNPGGASQVVPLAVLTSGFTTFETSGGGSNGYLRYYTNPTGPINIFKDTAFPVTDAGVRGMGVHNPPVVVVFASTGGGFTRIGEIEAAYCPSIVNHTSGYDIGGSLIGGIDGVQIAPNGTLYGRVAMAASESQPGVVHVVWSEGGDYGRVGDGDNCGPIGPFGGTRFTWDAGPSNRSYRVNYTTWSPSAKLTDDDIFESHIDRAAWYFTYSFDGGPNNYPVGYSWPGQDEFGALLCYDLRSDNANGDVLLFAGVTQSSLGDPPDAGSVWQDNALQWCDTLHVFDITSGTATLLRSITAASMPTELEADWAYPLDSASNQPDATPPIRKPDCMYAGPYPYSGSFLSTIGSFGVQAKAFGISDIYEDPLLDGEPVYLVHVPWALRSGPVIGFGGQHGLYPMRGFYRVPADMSRGFDFLDGLRLLQFTLLGPTGVVAWDDFDSGDFFSDPDNVWVPSPTISNPPTSGSAGLWFDRVCASQWKTIQNAETPSDFENALGFWVGNAACHGHHYDPESDTISNCSPVTDPATHIFAVEQFFICRGCRHCRCGIGVHIARRV